MSKDKVITDLLSRIANLEYEVEKLEKLNKMMINVFEDIYDCYFEVDEDEYYLSGINRFKNAKDF